MFFWLLYGPLIVSLLVAALFAGATRHSSASLPTLVRVTTGVGSAAAIGLVLVQDAWWSTPWLFPIPFPDLGRDTPLVFAMIRLMLPLIACSIALIIIAVPPPKPGPRGSAALAPRNPLTYTPTSWLWALTVTTVALAVVSVLAGLLSSTDEFGRHTMYEVEANDSSAATTIYGWWFSAWALIGVVIVFAIAFANLLMISRPTLGVDHESDTLTRRTRSRNVLVVTTGGILLHFSAVLTSLAGTSSLALSFQAGSAGMITLGTSFAALGPVLGVVGWLAFAAGLTMWWFVLFSIVPLHSRRLTASATP